MPNNPVAAQADRRAAATRVTSRFLRAYSYRTESIMFNRTALPRLQSLAASVLARIVFCGVIAAFSTFAAGTAHANTVPNVVLPGETQAAANAALIAAGLTANFSAALSGTVPVGQVISQSPLPGTTETAGTPVDVVIAGVAVPPITLGSSIAAATALLTAASLTENTGPSLVNSPEPLGTVAQVSPFPGTAVLQNSVVTLFPSGAVSSAPISLFGGGSNAVISYTPMADGDHIVGSCTACVTDGNGNTYDFSIGAGFDVGAIVYAQVGPPLIVVQQPPYTLLTGQYLCLPSPILTPSPPSSTMCVTYSGAYSITLSNGSGA